MDHKIFTLDDFLTRWNYAEYSYAGNTRKKLSMVERKVALNYQLIEANADDSKNIIHFSITAPADARPVVQQLLREGALPEPAFRIYPKDNFKEVGLVYFIQHRANSSNAISLLNRVQKGLVLEMKRKGYQSSSQAMLRNPFSDAFTVEMGTTREYELGELGAYVSTATQKLMWQTRKDAAIFPTATGRAAQNNLFGASRHFTYVAYRNSGFNAQAARVVVAEKLNELNREFDTPLLPTVVARVMDTLLSWCEENIVPMAVSPEFRAVQAERSSHRAVVKGKEARYTTALNMVAAGLASKAIAEQLNISTSAVRKLVQRAKAWEAEVMVQAEATAKQTHDASEEVAPTYSGLGKVTEIRNAPAGRADSGIGFAPVIVEMDDNWFPAPDPSTTPIDVEDEREDSTIFMSDFMKSLIG